MANTLGGLNLAAIAQAGLETLLPELPKFDAFTTNFSSDIASKGESVTTRVANAVTAGDASSGYSSTDVTSTAATITLNKHKHFTASFLDLEIAKSGWPLLADTFISPAIHSIADIMLDDLFALVTSSNYTNGTAVAAASFDADSCVDLAKELTDQNVSRQNRTLILEPGHYANLAKDDSVQRAAYYGGDVAKTNAIPMIAGLNVVEYASIPANSEDLQGMAMGKDALLIAARQPDVPTNWAGEVESVTDDESGFTMQFRTWYEPKDGARYISATAIYGVQVGNANSLHRVTAS